MASPSTTAAPAAAAPTAQPSTPPPSDNNSAPNTTLQAKQDAPLDAPRSSLQDTGEARRPREARLIHLVLSSMGINAYQERVPLQLLDFAYRYTSSVLSDSLRLSAEGYAGTNEGGKTGGRGRGGGGGGGAGGAHADAGGEGITVGSLRQAIASRQGYTFQGHLPKEWMLEQAEQHNKVALPKIETRTYGVQLPPEQFCLTGAGWSLREEWDDEEDEDEEVAGGNPGGAVKGPGAKEDAEMGGMDDEDENEDEEGAGRMEDVFGEEGGDTSMAEA